MNVSIKTITETLPSVILIQANLKHAATGEIPDRFIEKTSRGWIAIGARLVKTVRLPPSQNEGGQAV